jgi:pimeloyl-ACP methyl ester carboxylesterase
VRRRSRRVREQDVRDRGVRSCSPSWSLIGTADHVIPPARQMAMSTNADAHITTVNAGHLSLVTRPNAVVDIIETAVDATT